MSKSENSTWQENYKAALQEAKWRYTTHGLDASQRAYEYGNLVVKNAFWVAGGGVFFIPTMVGLSKTVDLEFAFYSGLLFGAAVLLALLANYIIHINWSLHESAWEKFYDIERIDIRLAFRVSHQRDAKDRETAEKAHANTNRWINRTFWAPHVLAFLYLVVLFGGVFFLYKSFGIVWEAKQ
ncbi:hypothetical protein [Phaeobacter sp. LSS9]|uniref:hypothetical protein n=1 Tax=unclassified Phaeobacter TaxID=2621772 RepID=UPI0013C35CCE|nr:hypothetical protein [Phaeobacter sp. LSS9]